MFEVKLRPSHPTGVYHRAGIQFNKVTPVEFDRLPKAVRDDPNLIVKEAEPIGAGPLPKSGAGPLGAKGDKGKNDKS